MIEEELKEKNISAIKLPKMIRTVKIEKITETTCRQLEIAK